MSVWYLKLSLQYICNPLRVRLPLGTFETTRWKVMIRVKLLWITVNYEHEKKMFCLICFRIKACLIRLNLGKKEDDNYSAFYIIILKMILFIYLFCNQKVLDLIQAFYQTYNINTSFARCPEIEVNCYGNFRWYLTNRSLVSW